MRLLNWATYVVGCVLLTITVNGWVQAACIVAAVFFLSLRLDFTPTIAHRALWHLLVIHRNLDVICRDLDREWLPMGGAENEAKRVIIAEIRDMTAPEIRELIQKENDK